MITSKKKDDLLLKQLSKIGISITDIYDLVNTNIEYENAIPVLVKNLNRNDINENILEGIIRALAVKSASGIANKPLLELFNKLENEKILLKWAIGNTFEVIIKEEDLNDIVPIINNKNNGISRQMFVISLKKIKSNSVQSILLELIDDPDVNIQALKVLQILKKPFEKEKIIPLLKSPNSNIRKEAKKLLSQNF